MTPVLKGLYAITPDNQCDALLVRQVRLSLEGGVNWVQYRDKGNDSARRLRQASQLRALTRAFGAGLIINDDIALALACAADGVHLGEHDSAIQAARQQLGPQAIIGASCYNDLTRAQQMADAGASYLAFGAIYPSSTKPTARPASLDILMQARQLFRLPICAIGGITEQRASEVVAHGADMIAVVSDLFSAADIQQKARRFGRAWLL